MAEVATVLSNGHQTVSVEDKFEAALNVIKNLPKNGSYKPSPEMMLKFYSYYKQATEGPCTKSKPWAWDIINKAKWDAWSKLGEMSRSRAMENYVENLKLIVEAMPATDNVQGFIKTLGNFYEAVDLEPPKQYQKFYKMTSTPKGSDNTPLLPNGNGSIHHHANRDSDRDSDSDSGSSVDDEERNEQPLTNGDASSHEHVPAAQSAHQQSDSEDEFCDTAEEIQTQLLDPNDSPMNSYTMVNNDDHMLEEHSSLSTLDETIGSEHHYQDDTMKTFMTTVKVRTRGGEHGTRGSDRGETSQQTSSGYASRPGGHGRGTVMQRDSGPGGAGGAGGNRPPMYSYSEVQDQIATTLLQLQQDMNSVLNRISMLEALTVGQQARRGRTTSGDSFASSTSHRQRSRDSLTVSWWPFKDLRPRTVFFIIAWPFVVRWIIHMVKKRRAFRRI